MEPIPNHPFFDISTSTPVRPGSRNNGVIFTPKAFQPIARGREASPRVIRPNGSLPRRSLRTLFNPSGVLIHFSSFPGVRFATRGYRLPTLRVDDTCSHTRW